MLRIQALTKRFGDAHVLRGVDLALDPGRVLALVGPNGAGKTTLIKSVLGLTRPDAGEIRFRGEIVRGDAYRARIGYMPQIARFPENLTAADLMAMLVDLRDAAATADRDVELVERFALEPHLRKPLRTLSGGTRQKVNAVLAFLFRPDLLVLDEPTAGLDPISSGILKDKVLAERAAGRSVLLTSHIMSEIEELADDVALLVDGRVEFHGRVDALLRASGQTRLERAVAQLLSAQSFAPCEAAA
ncbi:ABC transporter related protein (plasmid) [Gemmatirosa kalamazoonensis]|uniref:ABC transporter related protein n=1 Tax=Gemmatirosa kalamazoonensis TaxID=861299 RepID=W0RNG9_9BACT|nr:ABC transporter ATP-binding protein [Gemmatirosa kalamazoonensis]AHG92564.1 ABC transporter related protein [Gemmatirosa kalamazoonensis]